MDAYIKKIYDMLYSPIVTPYNLLENAKLENYSYVKYYKEDHEMVAEMACEISGEGKKIFYYFFDSKDYLQRICVSNKGTKEVVFSRDVAVKNAKEAYYLAKEAFEQVV